LIPAEGGILLVHGIFAGSWFWEPWSCELERLGYSCVAPTLSHLREWKRPPRARDYAAALVELVSDHPPSVVVGHSGGAVIATLVAEAISPQGLALVCPAGTHHDKMGITWAHVRHAWRFAAKAVASGSSWVPPDTTALRNLGMNRIPESEHEALISHFVPESGPFLRELGLHSVRADTSRLPSHRLVLAAEADRTISARTTRSVAMRLGVNHTMVGGTGHLMPLESHGGTGLNLLVDWLQTAVDRQMKGGDS
jgi:pimeloyl-ACP methyl ester carboxylesterase